MKIPGMQFHCGDEVQLKEDPRHIGVVTAIVSGMVHVKWKETTWKSEEKPEDLSFVLIDVTRRVK